jgi:hypothetical protein
VKTVIYCTQFVDPIRLFGYFKLDMLYGVKWVVKHVTSHVDAAFAEIDWRKPWKPSSRLDIRRKIELGSSRTKVVVKHTRTLLFTIVWPCIVTERLSETCRVVIPIKLEFSASVGFIHKEHSDTFVFHTRIITRLKFKMSFRRLVAEHSCFYQPASLTSYRQRWTEFYLGANKLTSKLLRSFVS